MLILPNIETTRLILRPIPHSDRLDVFEYASSPLVGPFSGWKPHKKLEETIDFINYCIKKREFGQPGNYAIIHKEDKKMIGTIEVHTYKQHKGEIGFVLNPKYWNKGYITEASHALIIYAFELLGLHRLTYGYFLFNQRSKRVCERLEFTFEGVLRKKFLNYDGRMFDEAISSITSDDYFNNKLTWLEKAKSTIIFHDVE